MKVLLIHDKDLRAARPGAAEGSVCSDGAGGLAIYVASLASELRRAGVEVATLDLRPRGSPPDPAGDGHRLEGFRFRYRPAAAEELALLVARERPDVVHLQSVASLHPLLVRRLLRLCPLVWSFHDAAPVCHRRTLLHAGGRPCPRRVGLACVAGGCYRLGSLEPFARDALRVAAHGFYLRSYRSASRIAVPSEYLRQVLLRNGFDAERVEVVPLFSRFEGAPEAGSASDGAPPRILFVGRMTRGKGVLALVEALRLLSDAPWTARFAGEGPERGAAEQGAREAGLAGRVSFAGELRGAALEREYGACDVVAVPSLEPESFGLVGVEAMAWGRPVVAFDAGGVREWLADGESGLLARHGDAAHLAERLRALLGDATLRARLGAAGRELQRRRFTGVAHVERLRALYGRALERRARASA